MFHIAEVSLQQTRIYRMLLWRYKHHQDDMDTQF